jgi:hypothetical protein
VGHLLVSKNAHAPHDQGEHEYEHHRTDGGELHGSGALTDERASHLCHDLHLYPFGAEKTNEGKPHQLLGVHGVTVMRTVRAMFVVLGTPG